MPNVYSTISSLKTYFNRRAFFLIAVGGVVVTGALAYMLNTPQTEQAPQRIPQVRIASVAALNNEVSPLSLVGQVRSRAEARLETESAGRVTRVSVSAGDNVRAGAILAEIENTRERAAVLQARGVVEAQEAALARVRRGMREEQLLALSVATQGAQRLYADARVGAVNAYKNAYAVADDAIRNKADTLFRNPRTASPRLIPAAVRFEEAASLQENRVRIEAMLSAWQQGAMAINSDSDVEAALGTAEANLRVISSFLETLAAATNKQEPYGDLTSAMINQQNALLWAARQSTDGALSSVLAARQNISNTETALQSARAREAEGVAGALPEDIQAAQAGVTQANGAYQAAIANLEKTFIRTPISGTVNTLSIRAGDYVGARQLAAIVSNNNALLIESFITSADRSEVAVGTKALIEGRYRGIVTNVAPGVDPTTGKVRIEIGVEDDEVPLANGDTVRVALARSSTTSSTSDKREIIIPITALKVETDRIVVFTVSENNLLVAHRIVEGPLLGNAIVVREGVDLSMSIVRDARGRNEGDEVEVILE